MFGVTPEGFVIKRLSDIRESMQTRARTAFGNRIQLHAKSVMGRLIDVFAAEQAETWEAIGAAYDAFDPNNAKGAALDIIGAINQLPRLPAIHSTGEIRIQGEPTTVIPKRTQVEQVVTGDIWVTTEEVTIDGAGEAVAPVRSLARGAFSAPGDPDPQSATLTQLANAITGVAQVWNEADAIIGRGVEIDSVYRARLFQDRNIGGTNRALSIEARLRALDGVFDALVILNTSDETDGEGRPLRTFEAVVDGGDDQAIADTLWEHKPNVIVPRHSNSAIAAGTDRTIEIVDPTGRTQDVRFSRPIEVQIEMVILADPMIDLGGDQAEFAEQLAIRFQEIQSLGADVRHYSYVCEVSALLKSYGHDFDDLTVGMARVGEPLLEATIPMTDVEIARLQTANIGFTP